MNASYILYALLTVATLLQLLQRQKGGAAFSSDFLSFRNLYLIVYSLAMGADWLQGPYFYDVYASHGYSGSEIAPLFVTGFAASMVFGTFIGSMADVIGRKKSALIFCVLYAASCATVSFADYKILMLGRFLGGIATSLLFSVFESWMVCEHNARQFSGEALGNVFSWAIFLGNGVVAIVAGLVASFMVEQRGATGPFEAAACCLAVLFVCVTLFWKENYGDQDAEIMASMGKALGALKDVRIPLLGLSQSFFCGAMYSFVFMWAPTLTAASAEKPNFGVIFSIFMACVMIGSSLLNYGLKYMSVESVCRINYLVAAAALAVPAFTENSAVLMTSFCVFEATVGIYFPTGGMMRAKYVPEEVRTTIMNYFRVPINALVLFALLKLQTMGPQTVFLFCMGCQLCAFLCTQLLVLSGAPAAEKPKKKTSSGRKSRKAD